MKAENLRGPWTIPNLITLMRLAVLPFFLYSIASERPVTALSLFVFAGISDGEVALRSDAAVDAVAF